MWPASTDKKSLMSDKAFIAKMTLRYFTFDGPMDQEIYARYGLSKIVNPDAIQSPLSQSSTTRRMMRVGNAIGVESLLPLSPARRDKVRTETSPELLEILSPSRATQKSSIRAHTKLSGTRTIPCNAETHGFEAELFQVAPAVQHQHCTDGVRMLGKSADVVLETQPSEASHTGTGNELLSLPRHGGFVRQNATSAGALTPSRKRRADQISPVNQNELPFNVSRVTSTPPSRKFDGDSSNRLSPSVSTSAAGNQCYPMRGSGSKWERSVYSQVASQQGSGHDTNKRRKKASLARGVEGIADADDGDEDAMDYSADERV